MYEKYVANETIEFSVETPDVTATLRHALSQFELSADDDDEPEHDNEQKDKRVEQQHQRQAINSAENRPVSVTERTTTALDGDALAALAKSKAVPVPGATSKRTSDWVRAATVCVVVLFVLSVICVCLC